MKRFLLLVFAFCALSCFAMDKDEEIFYRAIAWVESRNNDRVIGDGGNAVGRYQLWKIYVDDVNRIRGGSYYSYEDRYDASKSLEMVKVYVEHYSKRYERLTGKEATWEIKARIHNGGPNGWKKASTIRYWKKIREYMLARGL